MDIIKKSYFTIVQFYDLSILLKKMNIENQTVEEIKNLCDKNNISLLQYSLANRKFDISKYLLEHEAKVNNISKEGCNELHYLAANINSEKAIEIANKLIDKNVDLNLKDKKYKNSPLWYLCQEIFKKPSSEGIQLIIKCLEKKPDILSHNIAGYSIMKLIEKEGTEEIKKKIGEII